MMMFDGLIKFVVAQKHEKAGALYLRYRSQRFLKIIDWFSTLF